MASTFLRQMAAEIGWQEGHLAYKTCAIRFQRFSSGTTWEENLGGLGKLGAPEKQHLQHDKGR